MHSCVSPCSPPWGGGRRRVNTKLTKHTKRSCFRGWLSREAASIPCAARKAALGELGELGVSSSLAFLDPGTRTSATGEHALLYVPDLIAPCPRPDREIWGHARVHVPVPKEEPPAAARPGAHVFSAVRRLTPADG